MASLSTDQIDFKTLKDEWVSDVKAVVDQIADWLQSHPSSPKVERNISTVWEQNIGDYETPSLEADFGDGAVTVEAVGRNYPGHGLVQVQAWPTLRRVRLALWRDPQHKWTVITDSNIPLRQEWNQSNFLVLINDLLDQQ